MAAPVSSASSHLTILDESIIAFNRHFKEDGSNKDFAKISATVDKEIQRLEEFAIRSRAIEDEITAPGYCNRTVCCNSTAFKLWRLALATLIGQGLSLAAVIWAATKGDAIKGETGGIIVLSTGTTISALAAAYGIKVTTDIGRMRRLTRLNTEGLENARTLKTVIDLLIRVEEVSAKRLADKEPGPKVVSSPETLHKDDITDRIKDCLQAYEKLPERYQDDDTFVCLLSKLIVKLPSTNPVRKQLDRLEPTAEADSMITAATERVPINFFPEVARRSSIKVSRFVAEQGPRTGEEEVDDSAEDEEETRENLQRHYAHYKDFLADSFGLRRRIPYIKTQKGYIIDNKGIKKPRTSISVAKIEDYKEPENSIHVTGRPAAPPAVDTSLTYEPPTDYKPREPVTPRPLLAGVTSLSSIRIEAPPPSLKGEALAAAPTEHTGNKDLKLDLVPPPPEHDV